MDNMKFRAWYSGDIEMGEPLLFEQQEIDYELFFVCKEDPEIKYPFYIPFIDSDWIVEEYSGKKDKNGIEIYEGDIVEIEEKEHQYNKVSVNAYQEVIINIYQANVVFREGCFKLVEDSGLMDMVYNKTSKCKVIGNIHDKERVNE